MSFFTAIKFLNKVTVLQPLSYRRRLHTGFIATRHSGMSNFLSCEILLGQSLYVSHKRI